MSRAPDIDEFIEDPYEIPIKYIEEDDWQDADLDGWPEDNVVVHPPQQFRDGGNGE